MADFPHDDSADGADDGFQRDRHHDAGRGVRRQKGEKGCHERGSFYLEMKTSARRPKSTMSRGASRRHVPPQGGVRIDITAGDDDITIVASAVPTLEVDNP